MKDWWMNLSLRERQTLSIGGLCVALFLLYEIIWAPMSNALVSLRQQVQENSTLLIWMKQADQQMQAILEKPSKTNTSASLLSTVQTQVNKSPLGAHVTQLRQSENDAVQLTLKAVDFDQLITWLTQLGKNYDVIVTQITVSPVGGPGVVSTDIILKRD